jgi:hypothetical protein
MGSLLTRFFVGSLYIDDIARKRQPAGNAQRRVVDDCGRRALPTPDIWAAQIRAAHTFAGGSNARDSTERIEFSVHQIDIEPMQPEQAAEVSSPALLLDLSRDEDSQRSLPD